MARWVLLFLLAVTGTYKKTSKGWSRYFCSRKTSTMEEKAKTSFEEIHGGKDE
jgi:hypothetical protein